MLVTPANAPPARTRLRRTRRVDGEPHHRGRVGDPGCARRLAAPAQGLEGRAGLDPRAAPRGHRGRPAGAGAMGDARGRSRRVPPRHLHRAIPERQGSLRLHHRFEHAQRHQRTRLLGVHAGTPRRRPHGHGEPRLRAGGPAGPGDAARDGAVSGPIEITGVLRWPEPPGLFTPAGDPVRNIWFSRDSRAMAAAKNVADAAPFYVEMESPVPPGSLPHPGRVQPSLPNNHFQYALTWLGLADRAGRGLHRLDVRALAGAELAAGAARPGPENYLRAPARRKDINRIRYINSASFRRGGAPCACIPCAGEAEPLF